MEKFRGVDYYGVETLLSDEERMVRDAVRDWVEAEFLPLVIEHHRAGTFPMAVVPAARRARHLRRDPQGLRLRGPVERRVRADHAGARARGLGTPLLRLGAERARHVSHPPLRLGRAEGPVAARPSSSGAAIGCFGLTEPDHGSDPGGMATRAVRQGDDYVLNGTKLWITNGSVADVAVVWAKDEAGEIGGYLVERGTPGFGALDIHGKFSMRASITSELVLPGLPHPAREPAARRQGAQARRWRASPRRGTGSRGAPSAPPRPATTGRSSTGRRASSSASPSPASSSSSGSSCGWSRRSPRRSSCASSSAGSRTARASGPSRSRWPR